MRTLLLAALFLAAASAQAQTLEHITPPGHERARDEYHYTPAVRAGDFVFLSGVVAGRAPSETTDEAGFDRAFRAIARVLGEAGADWGDVVEMTTYQTDLPAQFELFSTVKDRHVAAPYPAWTAIEVDRLLPDGGLVEIRVIAYAPRD
ncbi:MAG TPA: RidA family protein [Terricaulis sp.]|nr:RidA family protein [Terricaulis sp.]